MGDVNSAQLTLTSGSVSGTGGLAVGGINSTDATVIKQILAGTASFTIPACSVGAVVTASAAVAGVTTSFNVLLFPNAWAANVPVIPCGAAGIANGIQMSATNAATGSLTAGAQTFGYFAWR